MKRQILGNQVEKSTLWQNVKAANCNMERKVGEVTQPKGGPQAPISSQQRGGGGKARGRLGVTLDHIPPPHPRPDTHTHTHPCPPFLPLQKPGPLPKPTFRKGSYSEGSVTNPVLLSFSAAELWPEGVLRSGRAQALRQCCCRARKAVGDSEGGPRLPPALVAAGSGAPQGA